MQKLRLQNTYNEDTNSFDKNKFELRESDKTISGKVSISSKKGEVWLSKPLPFIAFKSQIDDETKRALLNSGGQMFEAEFGLMVDSFEADGKEVKYIKLVINKAIADGKKDDKIWQQVEVNFANDAVNDLDDIIPF